MKIKTKIACPLKAIRKRLEYLRGEIEQLCSLAEHIGKDDVLLLQWADVPEFK